MNYKFTVLYEDNHLLVVFKPSGICVQGAAIDEPSLLKDAKDYIKKKYNKPGDVYLAPVHRLDKYVSGVVLFARTSKAAARISKQIKDKKMVKTYIALVDGIPPKEKTLIDYIDRDGSKSFITRNKTKGKEAILDYKVTKHNNSTALLKINLQTGRHHQIRLQLSNLGFPIIGDCKYGSLVPFKNKAIALHANSLKVTHPTTKELMTFTCPYPKIWDTFL